MAYHVIFFSAYLPPAFILTPPSTDPVLSCPFTQVPAFTSTSVCIQEGWHLQPDLLRQQRNTPGYRCWSLWFWTGDQCVGPSAASGRRHAGPPETSVGEGEWQKQTRLVVDCWRELLHLPVGEAEAGIQEHPALVIGSVMITIIQTLLKCCCKKCNLVLNSRTIHCFQTNRCWSRSSVWYSGPSESLMQWILGQVPRPLAFKLHFRVQTQLTVHQVILTG